MKMEKRRFNGDKIRDRKLKKFMVDRSRSETRYTEESETQKLIRIFRLKRTFTQLPRSSRITRYCHSMLGLSSFVLNLAIL